MGRFRSQRACIAAASSEGATNTDNHNPWSCGETNTYSGADQQTSSGSGASCYVKQATTTAPTTATPTTGAPTTEAPTTATPTAAPTTGAPTTTTPTTGAPTTAAPTTATPTTAAPTTGAPTRTTCARPSWGCYHGHDVYESLDCDGDGVMDHKCTTTINNNMWLVLSSEGCPNSWGSDSRSASECAQASTYQKTSQNGPTRRLQRLLVV